jgi:hypothetical protein
VTGDLSPVARLIHRLGEITRAVITKENKFRFVENGLCPWLAFSSKITPFSFAGLHQTLAGKTSRVVPLRVSA